MDALPAFPRNIPKKASFPSSAPLTMHEARFQELFEGAAGSEDEGLVEGITGVGAQGSTAGRDGGAFFTEGVLDPYVRHLPLN